MNDNSTSSERRTFLKQLGFAGAGLLMADKIRAADETKTTDAADFRVPRRKFGRHDFTVSSLCLGGHTLRLANDEEARKIVDAALAVGMDFFDNAWDYHDGTAEELMGKCIDGRRDKIFLMTKVCSNHLGGGAKRAMEMLEDSLRRFKTDHLDLWQCHTVSTMEHVESAYAAGGTLEAMTEAKKQGKVRFLGFTGHADPAVHLAMLSKGFLFDSCQMPINPLNDKRGKEFREKVLPELIKQGIAPLAMKTMCGDAAPIREGKLTPDEALRYALSAPIAAAVSGIRQVTELKQNTKIAASFVPLSKDQVSSIESRFIAESYTSRYAYFLQPGYRDGHGTC